jgi:protein TonB
VRPEPISTPALELPAPVASPRPAPVADPRPLAVPKQATVPGPGKGATSPLPIKHVDPQYTNQAGLAIEFKLPQVPAAAPVVMPGMYDGHGKPFYFFSPLTIQGVVPPKPIKSVTPKYTSEALRAKIQGDVEVEVEVLTDGTVGDVRVTKSLDTQFGLDDAAVTAARQWRFQPATKDGQPVEYTATLSLEFRIHNGPPTSPQVDPYLADTPGLVAPTITKWADPKYTSQAMREKIQGSVELNVVVQADGTIGEIRVTKSLDKEFGLDQEAVAAVKQFTFSPATLNGDFVPAIAQVRVEFRIH